MMSRGYFIHKMRLCFCQFWCSFILNSSGLGGSCRGNVFDVNLNRTGSLEFIFFTP